MCIGTKLTARLCQVMCGAGCAVQELLTCPLLRNLSSGSSNISINSSYHMGGCQNYGPCLGTLNIRCRIIIRTQKGTIILTTTHISNDIIPNMLC